MNKHYGTVQDNYTSYLATLGFSNSVVYDYKFRVEEFFIWLQQRQVDHIGELNSAHINTYFDYLQTRPNKRRSGLLSISHLNHSFMAMDKLMEFLHHVGHHNTPAPPNYRITINKAERLNKIQVFSQAEIKELIEQIPHSYQHFSFYHRELKREELKLVFTLYYACGLRRREGIELSIKDVNFDKRTIFIRQGKNYKDRIIPMNDNVYKALEHYIYNFRNLQKVKHSRLFLSIANTLNSSLKYLQKLSGNKVTRNKYLSLHILRHSIATHLLQNGMVIENISRFLGHSSLESTQLYTHIANRN